MVTPSLQMVYADYAVGLGDMHYVCLGNDVNDVQVIRLHDLNHTDGEGKYYRFVNMTLQQWLDLADIAPHVIEAIKALEDHDYSDQGFEDDWSETHNYPLDPTQEQKLHIGGNVFIHFKLGSEYIQVRVNFLPSTEGVDFSGEPDQFNVVPTRSGVCYKFAHWRKLVSEIPVINGLLKLQGPLQTCKAKHSSGENTIPVNECNHCNPNGYTYWLNEKEKQNQAGETEGTEQGNTEVHQTN